MKKKLPLFVTGILFPILLNAQWLSQASGFTSPNRGLYDISITDANTVWGIAYAGTVFNSKPEFTKTTNGGVLFTAGAFPPGWIWSNISALDSSTAWVSVVNASTGTDGAIFKTTDGGVTWNEQGVGTIFNSTSYSDLVYFWNANEGVAMGDPNPSEFEIYTTSDGGTTWTPVPGSAIPDPLVNEWGISNCFCTVGNDIWFSTNNARIFHSSDKGLTWTVNVTGIPATSSDWIDIAFWNANEGIARKYNYSSHINTYVSKTNDGGSTWNPVTVSGTLFGSQYYGLEYVPGTTSTLISMGESVNAAGSSYSNDGGNTWTLIDTTVRHYATGFLDNTTGWCSGFNTDSVNGGIYKYGGTPLSIYNPLNGKEIYFNVFPNPSDGIVMVHLANAGNDDLKISVLDISGRIVSELDFGKPGEFFIRSIDLSDLLTGIYLLKIVNGTNQYSKKLIIN